MPKAVALLDPIACCTPVRAETLDEATAETLARSFAALSDPIRLRLLSFIASADADEVCACDLTEPSGRSQPTVSHHMKILVDAGLVSTRKARTVGLVPTRAGTPRRAAIRTPLAPNSRAVWPENTRR